ncbi:unnamed protein product, partial [Prorocentrum cordatum]
MPSLATLCSVWGSYGSAVTAVRALTQTQKTKVAAGISGLSRAARAALCGQAACPWPGPPRGGAWRSGRSASSATSASPRPPARHLLLGAGPMGAEASGGGGDACCTWCDGHHECPYGHKVYGLQVTLPHEHNLIDLIALLFSAVPYYLAAHVLAYSLMRRRVRETSWLFFLAFVAVVSGTVREFVDSPRPQSCVPSCGWPSNHSAITVRAEPR